MKLSSNDRLPRTRWHHWNLNTGSSISYIQRQLDAATASNAEIALHRVKCVLLEPPARYHRARLVKMLTIERAEAREAAMIKSPGDRRSADGAHRPAGRAASRQ